MKSLEQLKKLAERGDYQRVADIIGCSRGLVEMVIKGERRDNKNIQQIFSDVLTTRQELKRKYRKSIKQQTF